MADDKEKNATPEISKEQMKFLVKSIWKCLQAPGWTKDSLITLGKVIYSKKALKDVDDKSFNEIWPHLKVMAETLDATLTEEAVKISAQAIEDAEKAPGDDHEKKDEKTEADPA
jgi:hypothetical protein